MARWSLLLVSLLAACGGSGPSGPAAPSPAAPADVAPVPVDGADTTLVADPGDGIALTRVLSGLRAPRDLAFGPPGSDLAEDLFVVHFEGPEATWVRDLAGARQVRRFQDSLVGAIAVDIDADGRLYFACLTPVMGAQVGVVTVRTTDNSVVDFQYAGVDQPSGLALDGGGGLYVFNRGDGTVSRIDFADGARVDGHAVAVIATGLAVTDDVLPAHLQVDAAGRLLIVETAADRVLRWDGDELVVLADAEDGLDLPVGLARLPSGRILVANHGDGRLVELAADGTPGDVVDTGLGAGRLMAVAARGDGAVFVLDDDGGSGSVYAVE